VLTVIPLVCTKLLKMKSSLAMRPLRLEGGAAWRNSGDLAGDLGRGVLGGGSRRYGEPIWVLV
jgi:hypothetical protein